MKKDWIYLIYNIEKLKLSKWKLIMKKREVAIMTSLYKCYYISKTVFYLSDHIPVYSVKKGKREQEGSELSASLTNIGTHKHYTQTDMNI